MMKKSYYPFGKQIQSKEAYEKQINRFKLYDYYGIPYGQFDAGEPDGITDYDLAVNKAVMYIFAEKKLPKELADYLLEQKELREKR